MAVTVEQKGRILRIVLLNGSCIPNMIEHHHQLEYEHNSHVSSLHDPFDPIDP